MKTKIITSSLLPIITVVSLSSVAIAEERRGPRGGPPAEAMTACADKNANDNCSFTSPHGEVTGTCMSSPRGEGDLACAPERGRPPR